MRSLSFQLIAVLQATLFLACAASIFAVSGEIDAEITPQERDNFYEARSRLWLPPSGGQVTATVVFLNGTDSDARSMVSNKEWQQFATKHQVALIGCHFRGDGEPYEEASQGSGDALLAMIAELSEKANCPDLAHAPLLIIGHSAGAMFAYNFTCWKPSSALAFVSVKSGPISPKKNPEAAKVPGLFIVGEHDLEGRVRSTANAYLERDVMNRLWALAVEPNGGHGSSESVRNMIRVYLEDILTLSKAGFLGAGKTSAFGQGVVRSLANPDHEYRISDQSASDSVWLPGTDSARLWHDFVMPVSLSEFVENGGIPDHQHQRTLGALIDLGEIDLREGDAPIQKSFVLDQEVPSDHGFVTEDKKVFLVSSQKRGNHDTLLTLGFDPDRLTPGIFRSSFQINKASGETRSFALRARVIANHRAKPASLYVGVIPRGRIAEILVSISDDSAPQVKIASIRSSKPIFAEAKTTEQGMILCRFDGTHAFGNQSGHFDVILEGDPQKRLRIPFIAWVSKQRAP